MRTLEGLHAVSIAAIACAALLVASAASAQRIHARKENQQDRIAQGVKSGQLTARETGKIERQESALNREERNMRRLDGGKLTGQDRKTINQQQNHLSREIDRQKHDAQAQVKPTTEISGRKENQQDRIANGIRSGQLTSDEAARLEGKESRLNAETRDMREDNGGKLSPAEKSLVNRQQNRLSGDIYREKHDAETQPH